MSKKHKHEEMNETQSAEVNVEELTAHYQAALDETESLKAKITELEESNQQFQNDYYRAVADTQNYRKRVQLENESAKKYRIQSFALEVLPVIDNLERALEAMGENDPQAQGIRMIYQQLLEALRKEGVEEIEALNQIFDANWHQALMSEKVEGAKAQEIVEVYQKGYRLKDRLLRPSLVKVSE